MHDVFGDSMSPSSNANYYKIGNVVNVYNKSMLFAGWVEVHIVKNCDQGLEHFQARGHIFSP